MKISKVTFFLCLVLVLASLGLAYVGTQKNALEVDRINITGTVRTSSALLLNQIHSDKPLYFWKLSSSQLKKSLLKNPWLEDLSTTWKMFPLEVNIAISEAKPWLVAEYKGFSWLVSRSGKLVQPLEQITGPDLVVELSELPRLDGIFKEGGSESEAEDARLRYAVKVIDLIDRAGKFPFAVERYTLIDQGIRLRAVEFDRYPEVSSNPSNLDEAKEVLYRLSLVLGDLKKRGERISSVDLRFGNQAVVIRSD